MGLFTYKKIEKTKEDSEPKDTTKTPFEEVKDTILEKYSKYDEDTLFEIEINFRSGDSIILGEQTKDTIAWLVANKLQNNPSVYTVTTKEGICIDLQEVEFFSVKPKNSKEKNR